MIGIIGAMSVEAKILIDAMTNKSEKTISGITYTCGILGKSDVVCAVSGVGKVFAAVCAQTMITEYKPDLIINTGVAGTLSGKIGILDVVVASGLVQHDMDTSFFGDEVGLISGINKIEIKTSEDVSQKICKCIENAGSKYFRGIIASGDCVVGEQKKKESIASTFGAIACEMEGGAVAQVCYINNIPFAVIRTISDGADDSASMSYTQFRDIAAAKSARIIQEYCSI